MIIEKNQQGVEVESNLGGNAVAMSIDEDSLAHIMGMLAGLYSDVPMAVLREAATNALDSHVEAGQTRPIEITLPTPLSPFLIIKDWGVGLNSDDIENIYSKYGASTKRDTNDQVGMLGFGCKSPLAYCAQFTLVGVKDGIRTTVNIGRDEDDGGTMTILDPEPTDEPNGVELQIPSSNHNVFEQKAKDLFKYWEPGTVLVNGEEPEQIDGLVINDEITVLKGDYWADDIIVMGNVPYPVDMGHPLGRGYSIVARVPIGVVNPAPSREALVEGKRLDEAIEDIKGVLKRDLKGSIQRSINKIEDPQEAFRFAAQWRSLKGTDSKSLEHDGVEIPSHFKVGENDQRIVITEYNSSPISKHQRTTTVYSTVLLNGIVVHGYDRPSFTPTQKKKLNKWHEDSGFTKTHHFVLVDKLSHVDTRWIDSSKVIDWATINEIKLPRTSNGYTPVPRDPNRPRYAYDVCGADGMKCGVSSDDLDPDNIFFVTKGEWDYYNPEQMARQLAPLITKFRKDAVIVPLAKNRIDKFNRLFPGTMDARDMAKVLFEVEVLPRITEEDMIREQINNDWRLRRGLEVLDASKVDDPELSKAIEIAVGSTSEIMKLADQFSINSEGCHTPSIDWDSPLDNYPLFDYDVDKDHLHMYVNAAYAARKDK